MTIIHIGYHKTGSTFLQNTIFPFVSADYVALPDDLLDGVQQPSETFRPDVFRAAIEAYVTPRLERDQEEARPLLLSNEALSGHPHGWTSIDPFETARNLHAAFPDARIIVVVRNQIDYLLSIYGFRVAVKGYEHRGLEQFLREEGELGLFAKLEYDQLVMHYIQLFGRDNVLVLPLELLKHHADDFLLRLSSFTQLILPMAIDSRRQVNESSRLIPVLRIWRLINFVFGYTLRGVSFVSHDRKKERKSVRAFRYAFYGLKRKVTPRLNRYFAGAEVLEVQAVPFIEELRRRYASSNARLEQETGYSFHALGYPCNPPQTAAGAEDDRQRPPNRTSPTRKPAP